MKHTIVVLHGWGLSAEKFDPLARCLRARKYDVFAPDFPGFGKSTPPASPLFLADYAKFLHGYLTKKRIKSPVFVGHSFGGRVSLKFVQMYPKEVRALILTGTPGFSPVARKKLTLFVALAKIGKFVFSVPPFSLVAEGVRTWYYYVVGAREYARAQGAMRETFKHIVAEELVEPMKSVSIPTLLVWGSEDIITPTTIAERMQKVIAGSRLISIEGEGHGVSYKNPERFAAEIEPFLQSL